MKLVKKKAFARAGLAGNPSDGYFGKTISIIVKNFCAQVIIYEWPEIEILPNQQDQCKFGNLDDLVEDIRLNGFYGGMRLIKATIARFVRYTIESGIKLPPVNFSLRYESNIPRQVGLAGSSAIITATFRGLCEFYEVVVPKEVLPNLILSVEKEDLGIGAGLQDRVAQVYEGLTYMDFDRSLMESRGYGEYESLRTELLPQMFLAYRTSLAEPSEVFHNNLRQRYESGEQLVIDTLNDIADYARQARDALVSGDIGRFRGAMDSNFDARTRIYNLNPKHVRMIELARELGAAANFAGSGGAIVGVLNGQQNFDALKQRFMQEGCAVIRPLYE